MAAGDQLPEGTVTIMFTDVVGSTELHTRMGDERALEILVKQAALIRDQVSQHAGQEIKSTGDGLMVAFASARKAVGCAAAIQHAVDRYNREHPGAGTLIRIGMNSGEVTPQGGDLLGAAVNAAARIAAKANGGQILVAPVVKDLAGVVPEVSFLNRGRFRLKGFPERWQLFEVAWQKEIEASAIAASLIDRTPLVGRQEELKRLRRHLEEAFQGKGKLVLVSGEPGIGKTRLCQEIAAEAEERGFRVLTGHCEEMEGAPPYLPFVEVLEAATKLVAPEDLRRALGDAATEVARILPHLRRVFPDIPAPFELPPEQERRYLFNSIREFVGRAAAIRPQCMIFDDIHWADQASLLLLEHLAEELREMRVLVLGTYRDVELAVRRPLAHTLQQLLRRQLAEDIVLRRLPEEDTAKMLAGMAGGKPPPQRLLTVVFAETEGTPLFVEEVFKHLAEEGRLLDMEGNWLTDIQVSEADVPRGVRLVIGMRLERLGDVSRKALTAAAVVGRNFSYSLLTRLTDADEEALLDAVDEAERAHLVTSAAEGSDVEFTFGHELIRQTLLSDLSLPRRQRLHLRVADALEEAYGDRIAEWAAELAHHLHQAGEAADPARTAKYLTLAGDEAMEAAAYEDALLRYENALLLTDADGGLTRPELVFKVGWAQMSLGRWDDAMTAWREALAAYEISGDADKVRELCYQMSVQLAWAGRWLECVEIAARGLAAPGEDVSQPQSGLLGISALAFGATGNYEAAESMSAQGLAVAEELGNARDIGLALGQRTVHHFLYMDPRRGEEEAHESARLLRDEGDLWSLANVLAFESMHLGALGRFDESRRVLDEAEPIAARLQHHGAMLLTHRLRWLTDLNWGDHDRCEESFQWDLEHCRRTGLPWYRESHSGLGLLEFYRGHLDQAIELCIKGTEYEFPDVQAGCNKGLLLVVRCYCGQREEAMRLLDSVREDLPILGRPNNVGAWSLALCAAEGMAVIGERGEAAGLYRTALAAIETGAVLRPFDLRIIQTVAGLSAASDGRWEAAESHFQTALRQTAELNKPPERAEALRFYGQMLIDRGGSADKDRAGGMLTEAAGRYQQMGWPRHQAMAEELLSRL